MSFLTVNEFAAFTTSCQALVNAKAEFDAKKAQVVGSWKELIEAGFKRINLPAWGKEELEARGHKIPTNRRNKINEAYTELMIEYVNSSDKARELIATKLDLGAVGTVTPKLWAQYVKACGKSLGGEIQTVRNELSKLMVKLGYAQVYVAPKAVTAESLAELFESKGLDIEMVAQAMVIYANTLGIVPPAEDILPALDPATVIHYGESLVDSLPMEALAAA